MLGQDDTVNTEWQKLHAKAPVEIPAAEEAVAAEEADGAVATQANELDS